MAKKESASLMSILMDLITGGKHSVKKAMKDIDPETRKKLKGMISKTKKELDEIDKEFQDL